MSESQRVEVSPLSVTGALELEAEAGRETFVSEPPAFDPDRPRPGTVLEDRYEVGELLGEGGMGYVLAARHVVLGTRLALKVLRREMTREAEMVERFRREARAASAIGHPNIVEVRDFGTLPSSDGRTPGASYFVMEHLEGQGLASAIERDGPFSVERAIDVIRQMADALGAAHAQGIVHRDVKPENVILTVRNGRPDHVKILDFGIAKLDSATRLSGAYRVLGTPAYMSPEQAQGLDLDARADVYSLGIVLYELLTGTLPFDDPRPFELIRMHVTMMPPSVLALRPDVPEVVAETIARALEKDRAKRPASMRAMMEMLAPFAVSRSAEFRRSAIESTVPAPILPPVAARPSAVSVAPAAPRSASFAATAPVVAATPEPTTPMPATRGSSRVLWWLGAAAAFSFVAAVVILAVMEVRAVAAAPAAARAPVLAPTAIAAPPPAPAVAPIVEPAEAASPPPIASTLTPAPPTPAAHPHHVASIPPPPEPTAAPEAAPVAVPEAPAAPGTRPTAQVIDPWD